MAWIGWGTADPGHDLETGDRSIGIGLDLDDPHPSELYVRGNLTVELPALASSSGTGNRRIACNGHGLSMGVGVSLPSGAGGALEIFFVESVPDVNTFIVDHDLANAITTAQGFCDPPLFEIDNGASMNKMMVAQNGSVGIDVTNPQGVLQVGMSQIVVPPPTGDPSIDWPNINNAIQTVNGSGTVCLQRGTEEIPAYVIDKTITIPGATKLIGAGRRDTIIFMDKIGVFTAIADEGGDPNQVMITSNGHGLSNGDMVTIVGDDDNTFYNGTYAISNCTDNTFNIVHDFDTTITGNWYPEVLRIIGTARLGLGATIKDLKIDTDEALYGVYIGIDNRCFWSHIENVEIDHMDIGIWVTLELNYFKGIEIEYSNTGILLGDEQGGPNGGFASANVFIDCYFSGCQNYAIWARYCCFNNKFIGLTIESNFGPNFDSAISLEETGEGKSNIVKDCYFEANDNCQIHISSNGNLIEGNFFAVSPNTFINPPQPDQSVNSRGTPNETPDDLLTRGGEYTATDHSRCYIVQIEDATHYRWSENSRWNYDPVYGVDPAATDWHTGVPINNTHGDIDSITYSASQLIITSTNHGLANYDWVTIVGAGLYNGPYEIVVRDLDTFVVYYPGDDQGPVNDVDWVLHQLLTNDPNLNFGVNICFEELINPINQYFEGQQWAIMALAPKDIVHFGVGNDAPTSGNSFVGNYDIQDNEYTDRILRRVGIGTTSPGGMLDVNGNSGIQKSQLLHTAGSGPGTLVITTENAFADVDVGTQLFAHEEYDYVIAKISDNEVIVDFPVDWGTGYTFSYKKPLLRLSDNGTMRLMQRADDMIFLSGNIYIQPFGDANISYLQARRIDSSGTAELQLRTWNNGTCTDAVRIDAGGNVGIGTVGPAYKLDVSGGDARIYGIGYSKAGDMARLYLGDGYAGVAALWGSGLRLAVFKVGGNGSLGTNSYDAITIAENIAAGAFVGIGVSNPTNLIETKGSVQYNTGTASRSGTTVTGSGTTFTSAMVGSVLVFNDGTTTHITGFTDGTHLTVADSGTVASQSYNIYYPGLNVKSDGKVGIGTASPTGKLSVVDTSNPEQAIFGDGRSGETSQIRIGLSGGTTDSLLVGYNGFDGYGFIQVNGTGDNIVISNSGKVGIGSTTPPSKLHVQGSVGVKVVTKTGNYTAADETVILVNTGTATITLPTASTVTGRTYYIKKISGTAGTITISRSGSDTIDGVSTKTLTTQYQGMQVVSDGTAWFIISLK